jgi:bifunctional non-homologous end joining protein LigD
VHPDFPLICERMPMRRQTVAVMFVIFDLLSLEARPTIRLPCRERRAELESLALNDVHWMTPEAFDDGSALFEAVCEHELEGVVAKRRSSPYRPGERLWIKTKNREYWRYEIERESAISVTSRKRAIARTRTLSS